MKIYDKAQWHIDAGMETNRVLDRLKIVFEFLVAEEFLTDEGLELFELGIDSSISLNESILNEKGNRFLTLYYDKLINLENSELKATFKTYLVEFHN